MPRLLPGTAAGDAVAYPLDAPELLDDEPAHSAARTRSERAAWGRARRVGPGRASAGPSLRSRSTARGAVDHDDVTIDHLRLADQERGWCPMAGRVPWWRVQMRVSTIGERPFMASTDESLASWVSVTPFEP